MLANLHDCDLLLNYKIINLFHLVIRVSICYTQFLQHKANAELLSRDLKETHKAFHSNWIQQSHDFFSGQDSVILSLRNNILGVSLILIGVQFNKQARKNELRK
jgi:hypothetical protein